MKRRFNLYMLYKKYIRKKMKQHVREGSIKHHLQLVHNKNLEIEKCLKNTVII